MRRSGGRSDRSSRSGRTGSRSCSRSSGRSSRATSATSGFRKRQYLSDDAKRNLPCWKDKCQNVNCPFQHRALTATERAEKDKAKKRRKSSATAAPSPSPSAPSVSFAAAEELQERVHAVQRRRRREAVRVAVEGREQVRLALLVGARDHEQIALL